jgi:hypothetical protein
METSYYNIQKTFLNGITVLDIAEPLVSFDSSTPAGTVLAVMEEKGYQVAGIRQQGLVTGYVERGDLGDGPCGNFARSFDDVVVLADTAKLTEVVQALNLRPWAFVRMMGVVSGLVSRADLLEPPVRMWLFGMITMLELRFLTIIERRFDDERWKRYLSPARLNKARELQQERARRYQKISLLECLQFSDKAQIVVRDETLRQQAGIASRRRGDEVIKSLERLRNNLAHAQDIVAFDWETIVGMAEQLERVIELGGRS